VLHNLVLLLIAFIIVAVDGSSSQSSRPRVHMLRSVQSFPRRLATFSNLLRRGGQQQQTHQHGARDQRFLADCKNVQSGRSPNRICTFLRLTRAIISALFGLLDSMEQ
jgi:hypothetical protein